MTTTCPECGADRPDVLDVRPNQQQRLSCRRCDHIWLAGDPVRLTASNRNAPVAYGTARALFPTPEQVAPDRRERVDQLKAYFLTEVCPIPRPEVVEYWERYQWVFSREGLEKAPAKDFHYFANSGTGASPGNMSVFNLAWTELGAGAAADRVREATRFLLYATEPPQLEDRLTELLRPEAPLGMKGWKEALLTKTLCVMHPTDWLPIVTYDARDVGKRDLTRRIWGLQLPARDRTSMTRGRLAGWSNNLMLALCGQGFVNGQHAAEFVWWVKEHEGYLAGNAASPSLNQPAPRASGFGAGR